MCQRRRLAQPAGREARRHLPDAPGGRDWLHPSPCRTQSLPGELLASWIAALRAVQFSRAKRPFSGAIAVGMARLGGFDPEFPVENGTRQRSIREPSWAGIFTNQIRRMKTVVCRSGRRSKRSRQSATQQKDRGLGRDDAQNLGDRPAPHLRQTKIYLPRLNKACPNPSKWRELLGIRGARPGYRVSALALACPFGGKRGDYFKGAAARRRTASSTRSMS